MTTAVQDSRASTVEPGTKPYVSSESEAARVWGQPPATHYVFTIRDSVIVGVLRSGIYAEAIDTASARPVDPALLAELSMWDLASDRDLNAFEGSLG